MSLSSIASTITRESIGCPALSSELDDVFAAD